MRGHSFIIVKLQQISRGDKRVMAKWIYGFI